MYIVLDDPLCNVAILLMKWNEYRYSILLLSTTLVLSASMLSTQHLE